MTTGSGPAGEARRGPDWKEWLTSGWLPALLVFALYLPVLRYAFVWDDERLITNNALLRTWPGLWWALRSDFWLTVGQNASGFWRPLITLSYAADGILFEWKPWGFHFMNLLAAAGVAALVTALARRFGTGRWPALIAGAWFAAMPHHVESVAWVAGRTDVYSAFFCLLALWLEGRDRDAGARAPRWPALLAFGVALLTKEAAMMFVVVSLALHWSEGRPSWREALRWTAPYLVLTALYVAVHLALVATASPPQFLSADTLRRGRLSAWVMFPGYLSFLWPAFPHTPAVVVRLPETWRDLGVISSIVLQAAVVAALVASLQRRSRWAVAWVVLWVTLLPTTLANLFQSYLLYNERFMYLPSIGAAWLLALALSALAPRVRFVRLAAWAGALALLGNAAWATTRTLPDWRDDETLYRSMTEKQPRNAMGWFLLARLRLGQGDEQEADRMLVRLQGIDSSRPQLLSIRALIHYRHGEWDKVVDYANRALALDPTLGEARLARATALLRLGRLAEAEQAIAQLRVMLPENALVASLEGQRLLALRQPEAALPLLRKAAEWIHDDPDLQYAIGLSSAMLNQVPAARVAFEECVRIEPTLYDGWLRLATACHVLGDVAARDAALAKAAALPEASDGRVGQLRARMLAVSR